MAKHHLVRGIFEVVFFDFGGQPRGLFADELLEVDQAVKVRVVIRFILAGIEHNACERSAAERIKGSSRDLVGGFRSHDQASTEK